jgi:hypothetical protein
MTRHLSISGAPRDHAADPNDWTATLSDLVPVRYAQALVRNLDRALEHTTVDALADKTGVGRSTIWALRTGRRWPDLLTVSRLEWNLGQRLWPLEELLFADTQERDIVRDERRTRESPLSA